MTVLLKEAIKPNLVQTLEGQPAFVHCGPVREHRPRQQLARRRPRRAQAGRLRDHGERLRLGHGHGEVLRHRLPGRRPTPERRRARRHGEGAQAPRRRHRGRPGGDRGRRRQPGAGTSAIINELRPAGRRRPSTASRPTRTTSWTRCSSSRSSTEPTQPRSTRRSSAAARVQSALAEAVVDAADQPNSFGFRTPSTRRSRRRSGRS